MSLNVNRVFTFLLFLFLTGCASLKPIEPVQSSSSYRVGDICLWVSPDRNSYNYKNSNVYFPLFYSKDYICHNAVRYPGDYHFKNLFNDLDLYDDINLSSDVIRGYFAQARFSEADRGFFFLDSGRNVSFKRFDDDSFARVFEGDFRGFVSFALSKDYKYLAAGGSSDYIFIFDVESGAVINRFKTGHLGITKVEFMYDGSGLVTSGKDKLVKIWDFPSGDLRGFFEGHSKIVREIKVSSDNKLIVSVGFDGSAFLWRSTDFERVFEFDCNWAEYSLGAYSAAFSPDRTTLAIGCDGFIRIWTYGYPNFIVRTLGFHHAPINSVHFSPDGNNLVASSDDSSISYWDLLSGELISYFGISRYFSSSVQFDLTGSYVLSSGGGRERAIRLWRVK